MRSAGRNLCRRELEKAALETVISSGTTGRVGYVAACCGGHLLGGRRASARRLQQMRSVLGRLDAAAEILQVGSSFGRDGGTGFGGGGSRIDRPGPCAKRRWWERLTACQPAGGPALQDAGGERS